MKLWVLYDADCAFCRSCRRFLERQPQLAPLRFVDCRSEKAAARFPKINRCAELIVVSEEGFVWRGPDAFILCAWALRDTRWLSYWLSGELLGGLSHWLFGMLSKHRSKLSGIAGTEVCAGEHCGVPHRASAYR